MSEKEKVEFVSLGEMQTVPASAEPLVVSGLSASCDDGEVCDVQLKEQRQSWGSKLDFVLSCVGYAVGLGNVWRFPYLCYKSGGGAFLIPYFIFLLICGIPLLYMELAVGQFTRLGPVGAMGKICPMFSGVGMATVVITFLLLTYYIVIMVWALFYLFSSFFSTLPFLSCGNEWNTVNCWSNFTIDRALKPNDTIAATEEFFNHRVLEITKGVDLPGSMRWELFGLLVLGWVIVYFTLWKGIKWSGKVVYVTVLFPYVLLLIFVVQGATLPGAMRGITYLFTPRWELLKESDVWVNACAQVFGSIGIAFGSFIALASYNRFDNNIGRDALIIALVNSVTSLFAGIAIFSIIGYIAEQQGEDDINKVLTQGPGLVFVAYPEVFATLPISPIWSVLFFVMLLMLGLDTQFAMVEVVITTLEDFYGIQIKKYLKGREVLVLLICFVSFICGLPNITQGGMYFFQILDYYASAVSIFFLAFFEVIAITWIYGGNRLAHDIKAMTGQMPFIYFRICWIVAAPLLVLGIWIFSYVQYKQLTYGKNYEYPDWADAIGWCFASTSILCIPFGAALAIYKAPGFSLLAKFRNALRSPIGPNYAKEMHAELSVTTSTVVRSTTSELPDTKAWTSDNEKKSLRFDSSSFTKL